MAITLIDYLTFPFNDGKGLRTDQLEGPYNEEQFRALGSGALPTSSLKWLRHKSWWTGNDETERLLAVAYDNDAPWAFVRTKTGNLLILSDGSRRELAGAAFDPNGVAIVEDHAYTLNDRELSIWDGSDKRLLHVGVSGAHLYRLPVAAETDQWLGIDASATEFFSLRTNEAGDDLDLAKSNVSEITRPPFHGSDQLARMTIVAAPAAAGGVWNSVDYDSAATGDRRVYEAVGDFIEIGSFDIENSRPHSDNGGELVRMEITSGITGGVELELDSTGGRTKLGSFTGDNNIKSNLDIGTVRITGTGTHVTLVIRRTLASTDNFSAWVNSQDDDGGDGKSFYLIDAAGNTTEFLVSARSDAGGGYINWSGYASSVTSRARGEVFTLIVARSGGLSAHTFLSLSRTMASTAVWPDWDKQRYSLYYVSPDPDNVVQEILFEDVYLETDDILEWRIPGATSPARPATSATFRIVIAERGGLSLVAEDATVLSDPTLLTVPMTDPPSGLPIAMSVRNDKLAVLFTGGGVGVWDVAANAVTRASDEGVNFNQHVSADTPTSLIFDGLPLIYHTSDYVRQWKTAGTPVSMDVAAALPAVADQPRTRLTAIGADGDSGLSGTPHYHKESATTEISLRVDYLGAGRIGYCSESLGDDRILGRALSKGGSVDPSADGLIGLIQESVGLNKTRLVLTTTSGKLITGGASHVILKPRRGVEAETTIRMPIVGSPPTGTRQWKSATRNTPDFNVDTVYRIRIGSPEGAIEFHEGDYLTPLFDRLAFDTEMTDLKSAVLIDAEQRGRVRSIPSTPKIDANNFRNVQINHTSGRAWIGKVIPAALVRAVGTSSLWVPSGTAFKGVLDSDPALTGTSNGNIYYNNSSHLWMERSGNIGTAIGIWGPETFRTAIADFPKVHHWLGERVDANDAANHLQAPKHADQIYLFYSESSQKIEQIDTFTKATDQQYLYEGQYLATDRDVAAAEVRVKSETVCHSLTGFSILHNATVAEQKTWLAAQRIDFTRILTSKDDSKLMSIEIRWREVDSTSGNTNPITQRFAGTTIPAALFRGFAPVVSGKVDHTAEIFVRRPDWTEDNLTTLDSMKITYGRYRMDAATNVIAKDGIAFAFARGVVTNATDIDNMRVTIRLHN